MLARTNERGKGGGRLLICFDGRIAKTIQKEGLFANGTRDGLIMMIMMMMPTGGRASERAAERPTRKGNLIAAARAPNPACSLS